MMHLIDKKGDELIQAIAEDCDFYVGNEHYDKTPEEKQRLWVQRYTEVVVRQCLYTIAGGVTRDGRHTEKFQRSAKHIQDVRNRFGLENDET